LGNGGGNRVAVSLRLLGPLEARAGGRVISLGPRKQRLVLAVLALEVSRPVEVARLVGLAWPEGAPRTAGHAIRVCVSGLRSALAGVPGVEIRTEGSGYALVTDPVTIDVHRFRSLLGQARGTSDDTLRAALLDRALGLWEGDALDGTAAPETRQRLFVGLDEARLGAQEDLLDARLRLGHHHELAGELAVLVAAHL
jgi:DNA-binding SARP family transcriptional activator